MPDISAGIALAPAAGAVLRVSNLTKHYGQLRALSGVSFEVRQGEVLGLIGPNGSGKTTLFECLGGVLPFDGGTIASVPATPDARRPTPDSRLPTLFYLPDGIAPWPAQRVRWALEFVCGLFDGPPDLQDAIVQALDLTPLLEVAIGHLSKGQRKRVLLGIGLLTPAPLLLADEPFDGLDLRQSRDVARVLQDVATSGRTLFLSIHQIADAARICDRFVLLSSGQVRGEGTLDELSALASSRGHAPTRDLEEIFLALT